MTTRVRRARVAAFTLSVAACARTDGDVMDRDSAGVRLVINDATGNGWSGETPWRVTEELAIGSDTISEEYRRGPALPMVGLPGPLWIAATYRFTTPRADWCLASVTPDGSPGRSHQRTERRWSKLLRTKLRAIGGDASFADSPQVEAPADFPAISTVRAGPRGTIWLQLMGPVASIDPMAINAPDRADFLGGSTWHVLDSSGRYPVLRRQ